MRAGLIPARGGSKGIRMKNLHPVLGRPMIAYALEAVTASSCEKTFVSTDNEEIARLSEAMGAEIVWRPGELSSDESTTVDCVRHFLGEIESAEEVALVQATSPMVTPGDVDACLSLLSEGFDSGVTMSRSHDVLWALRGGSMEPVNHEMGRRVRRQDMGDTFSETGSVYAFKTASFKKHLSIPCGRVGLVEIAKSRAFQVDDMEDLEIVEAIMTKKVRS